MTEIFLGIMCIALVCWHLDEIPKRYREKQQRDRKPCQWKELG